MDATQCIMEACDKCMYDVKVEGMEIEWKLLTNACMMTQTLSYGDEIQRKPDVRKSQGSSKLLCYMWPVL